MKPIPSITVLPTSHILVWWVRFKEHLVIIFNPNFCVWTGKIGDEHQLLHDGGQPRNDRQSSFTPPCLRSGHVGHPNRPPEKNWRYPRVRLRGGGKVVRRTRGRDHAVFRPGQTGHHGRDSLYPHQLAYRHGPQALHRSKQGTNNSLNMKVHYTMIY